MGARGKADSIAKSAVFCLFAVTKQTTKGTKVAQSGSAEILHISGQTFWEYTSCRFLAPWGTPKGELHGTDVREKNARQSDGDHLPRSGRLWLRVRPTARLRERDTTLRAFGGAVCGQRDLCG